MIKKIYDKLMTREIILYLVFGVLTTLVNLGVFQAGTFVGFDYRIANLIAWAAAVLFAFITNKLFVFESKNRDMYLLVKELLAFIACRLLSGAFDMGYMIAVIEYFAMPAMIAKITSNVFVVIMNYIFSKLIIFRQKPEKN